MVKSDYEHDVKTFLSDALAAWVPFFVKVLELQLLQADEQTFQGLVTLKIQIIRVNRIEVLNSNHKCANIARP